MMKRSFETWRVGGFLLACALAAAACKSTTISGLDGELCAAGQYTCHGDVLQVCNADRSGWDDLKTCAPGTCAQGKSSCDGDLLAADSGSTDPDAGEPPPPTGSDAGAPGSTGKFEWVKSYPGVFAGPTSVLGDDTIVTANSGTAGSATIDGQPPITVGTDDVIVARLDPNGSATWAKTFGGTGPNPADRPSSVSASAAGVFVSGIHDTNTLSIGPDSLTRTGNRAGWLAKLDPATGAPQWGRSVKTTQANYNLTCFGVAATAAGVAVGCTFQDTSVTLGATNVPVGANGGNNEAVVAFFDNAGALKWTNIFKGTGDEKLARLAATPNGDILVVLNTTSPSLKDTLTPLDLAKPGATNVSVPYLGRLSGTDGKVLFSKFLGAGGATGTSLAVSTDGATIAVVGIITGSAPAPDFGITALSPRGSTDGFLLVLDAATRTPKWQKQIGGTNPDPAGGDDARTVAFDAYGQIAVGGIMRSSDTRIDNTSIPSPPQNQSTGGHGAWAAKFSPDGANVLWVKGYTTQALADVVGIDTIGFTSTGAVRVGGELQGTAPLDGTNNVTATTAGVQSVVWGFDP